MIDAFVEGHYYRWNGPKWEKVPKDWSPKMAFMLDGEPHLCTATLEGAPTYAAFEEDARSSYMWTWYTGFKYIEEVVEKEEELGTRFDSSCTKVEDKKSVAPRYIWDIIDTLDERGL